MYAKPLMIVILIVFLAGIAAGVFISIKLFDVEVKWLGLPYKKQNFATARDLVIKRRNSFIALPKGTNLVKEIDLEHTMIYKIPIVVSGEQEHKYLEEAGDNRIFKYKISTEHIVD